MSNEATQLLIIKGVISDLPKEDQSKVFECADKMRALISEYGDFGMAAAGLVGAEFAAKE